MSPIRMPCNKAMKNTGSQSRNGWFTPKIPIKHSQMIRRLPEKPCNLMSSNLERPPDKRFIKSPKNRKLGTKPYQKRFSLVASKMPLPARIKPSNHFLQFMETIITYVVLTIVFFSQLEISPHKTIRYIGEYILKIIIPNCQVIGVRFLGIYLCFASEIL